MKNLFVFAVVIVALFVLGGECRSEGIIVTFDDSEGRAFAEPAAVGVPIVCEISEINTLVSAYGISEVKPLWRGSYAGIKNIYLLTPDTAMSSIQLEAMAAEFQNVDGVASASIDGSFSFFSDPLIVEPNDYWYNHSYPWDDHSACFEDTTHRRQWNLTRSKYPRAWAISTGDSSIVVSVLDTGLDIDHPDIVERLCWNDAELNGLENIDDDNNGYVDDVCGWDFIYNDPNPNHLDPNGNTGHRHGSMMASIIGATSNNEPDSTSFQGVAAITWKPKILPLKISQTGSGLFAHAVEAINYVIDYNVRNPGQQVRVMNMSFGGGQNNDIEEAILKAKNAGIMTVAGAGNYDNSYVFFPARSPYTLGVACVDSFGVKLSGNDGSCYGPQVDVCGFGAQNGYGNWAPPATGKAFQMQALTYEEDEPLLNLCGTTYPHQIWVCPMFTSGATAQASGLAALIYSEHPNLSVDQVKAMICRGAVDVDQWNPGYAGLLGEGYLDAYRTLSLWGTVASDTTLSGEVWISGDVVVDSGVTLTFAPGAVVHVAPDDNEPASGYDPALCALVIRGGLEINGTASNPVTISGWSDGPEEGDWKGIIVDQNAGNINIEHLILKHAEIGVFTYGVDIDVAHCEFDSCGTGIFIEEAGGTIHNVLAQNCGDKGFYVLGASGSFASAVFDSCRANSNNYGFYFDDYTNSCTISNKCEADNNVINGILCRSSMTIGPKVSMDNNGQDGLRLMYAGSSGVVQGVKAINHSSGAGLRCNFSSSPEIKDCYFSNNYDNVTAKYTSYPILGDVANSKGKNNSILTATRYDVGNFNKNWTMMAENCYWGPTGSGSMPALSISGSVDISPWLTSDPGFSWRLPQGGFVRNSWVSENYPNPFNPETRIKYFVANSGDKVTIQIYDISGKLVKELANEQKAAGLHSIIWNGRNNTGEGVASGVYFARVKVGSDLDETKKLMLVK